MTVFDIVPPLVVYKELTNPFVTSHSSDRKMSLNCFTVLVTGKHLVSLTCCVTSVTSSVYVSCIPLIQAVKTVQTAHLSLCHKPAEAGAAFLKLLYEIYEFTTFAT